MPKPAKKKPKKTGPEADRLKLLMDWKTAVKTSLIKVRPKKGWPKG